MKTSSVCARRVFYMIALCFVASCGTRSGRDPVEPEATPTPTPDPTPPETVEEFFENATEAALSVEVADVLAPLSKPSEPIARYFNFLIDQIETQKDPVCPRIEEEKVGGVTRRSYFGEGCTLPGDNLVDPIDDTTFEGTLVLEIDGPQTNYELDAFGIVGRVACEGKTLALGTTNDGMISRVLDGPAGDYTFKVRTHQIAATPACELEETTLGYDVRATHEFTGADLDANGSPDEKIVFSSDGTVVDTRYGRWTANSVGLTYSNIDKIPGTDTNCREPIDGDFALTAGGHDVRVQSDGATACTVDACSPWDFDGVAQDVDVCGVGGCSVTGIVERPGLVWALITIALALQLRQRRS